MTSTLLLLLAAAPAAASSSDPVLDALAAEAAQAKEALGKSHDTPLYYLSYRVHDGLNYEIGASFGALTTQLSEPDRSRTLDVSVRVGSPQLDNTHKLLGGGFFDPDEARFSFGAEPQRLPVEDDPTALRLGLWKATDKAYQTAVKRLIRVRTNTKVKVKGEDDSDDFSTEPPQVSVGAVDRPALDLTAWAARLERVSAVFKKHPEVLSSFAWLSGTSNVEYFVDTDGARIREPRANFRIMLLAVAKADDGMDLPLFHDFVAKSPDQLPSEAELAQAAADMAQELEALRKAPVIDPYNGPAIIASRAAAVFFHEVFGHRMEGHRQKDADEGHTFTHKVGQQVLPTFMSVVDDPTQPRAANTWLNGSYRFDDQGVPAQPALLVDKGILRGFLMERSPIKGFDKSNGHGRAQAGLAPVARQGNLIVSTTKPVPFAELRRQLIEEVKKRGKPYGLIFDDISGGFTFTQAAMLPQAFKVLPLVVKRVYPDGRPDELVRGVDLIGTPLQAFEKILATGDDPGVFNGVCGAESGWVPVAAVSPSLLVREIEVDRREPDHNKPPILPPPPVAPTPTGATADGRAR